MGDRRRTKTRLKLSLVDGIDRSFTNHRPFNTSLLSFIVLSLVFLCNANDNSQFDMRPFQASPHQLMRRQDGHSHHQIPVLDIASIPRLSSNEPNLMPILTAPVPRGSSHSKPSFQRIRLNKPTSSAQRQPIPTPPPLLPPSNQFTFNESPINNFQRLAGFNHGQPKPLVQPQTFAQPMSSFPSLINDAPPPPPPSPQRQSFRRVKPNSGSRRSKPKHSSPIPLPTRTIDVSSRRITSTNLALPSVHGQAVRGRGPVNAHDDDLRHKANALDNEDENEPSNPFFGNRVPSSSSSSTSDNGSQGDNGILLIESLSRNPITSSMFPSPQSSVHTTTTTTNGLIHTPTIPLTYYTTFTYFTTVLRGQHTAMLSREIVSSTTHLQPIDRSVVTAIEFNDGYIRPSKTLVPLGMKTKGQTTTIYNMGSRVQIFNDDLYKVIHATKSKSFEPSSSSSSRKVTPTSPSSSPSSSSLREDQFLRVSSPPVSRVKPTQTHTRPKHRHSAIELKELEKQAKHYLTKYTYFYTFISDSNTRYSTRVEETTSKFGGNLATLAPSLASSIDSDGLLPIVPTKSATVALGSRANGRMTTVVNLALNNYIHFDNVKDVHLKISPTQVVSLDQTMSSTLAHQTNPLIASSFDESGSISSSPIGQIGSITSHNGHSTPQLNNDHILRSNSLIVSSNSADTFDMISRTSSPSRSRSSSAVSRRPIRVKVKPIRSKLATLSRVSSQVLSSSLNVGTTSLSSSSIISQSSTAGLAEQSITPTLSIISSFTSDLPQSSIVSLHQLYSSSSSSSSTTESIVSTPVISSRKKVAYTVRRPTSGINRYFHRRPSSHLIQRSSSVFILSPSVQYEDISSSQTISPIYTPTSVYSSSIVHPSRPSVTIELEPSSPKMESSVRSNELQSNTPILKPSKTSKSRLVVLTRLAGALNKWNPLYNSRVRVSSRKVFKSTSLFELSSMPMETSTVYETTTHTVPFTLGATTVFTTVEETNSRVVTMHPISTTSDLVSSSIMSTIIGDDDDDDDDDIVSTSSVRFVDSQPSKSMINSNVYESDDGILTMASPTVVVDTTDVLTTSTLYSTFTYFATLFNGTQTMITPLEEIKTEYLTLREPMVITRTIMPNFDGASTLEPTQVITVPIETSTIENMKDASTVTDTYSTHTVLTHFITLFSGSKTILSSIEEISPTVLTKTRVIVPTSSMSIDMSDLSSSSTSSSSLSDISPSSSTPMLVPPMVEISSSVSINPSSFNTVDSSADHSKSSAINSESKQLDATLFNKEQMDKAVSSIMTMAFGPSTTLVNEEHSSSTTAVIEPGSVIELDDLLGGVQDAGQIGETIKDIVNNIVIRPETNPSDETTTSTNDAESQTDIPPTTTTSLAPSFNPSASGERTTPNLNSVKNRFPAYIASQNLPKYYMSSNEDKSLVIFSTQAADGDTSELPMSTRYVTSIEKSIKTLTLTSTKVYYTRDSPLTITSILTTTLPPVTYVSTIIGSKTILGTYNSITPTKTSSIDVSPTTTSSSSPVSPSTNRPRLHRPKNQEQPTLLKAKVVPFLNGKKISSTSPPTTISRNVTIGYESELQLCSPACNVTNKEHCKESESGRYSCECRPGYVRRPSDNMCQEIKNYLVMVRVSKTSENEVASAGNDLQSITRVARRQVGKKEGIAGLQVVSVERNSRNNGASMVNLTIQLDRVMPNVHDDLLKKLQSLGQVEKVVDFDECSSHIHNDCSPRARCINEPGSYRCQCLDNFINLDQSLPGRLCSSEMKSCEYCHGRGDCWKNQGNTVCRCHPMFIGRRCEINGLLLAILVPIVAILVIVAIVCFLYCSRKLRQRNRRFKNLSAYGPVAVIGGTLDRKAMLETSSESSDPQHRSSHYANESNPASARGSMARRNGSRRESEPSLDRSMASYSAAGSHYNSLPPQILIPRARPPYTIHPGQVYMW